MNNLKKDLVFIASITTQTSYENLFSQFYPNFGKDKNEKRFITL